MLLKQEIVTFEKVCKEFEKRTSVNQYIKSESLLDIFEKFIEVKKPTNSVNTIKTYNTVKKHLDSFSQESGFVLEFENFDLNFYDNFVGYFLADDYLNSSIGKFITIIKTFLNWAYERGSFKKNPMFIINIWF